MNPIDATALSPLIYGMVAMASVVASLAFFKFWKVSGDRFFGWFALSFALMALNRVALAIIPLDIEGRSLLFWLRLFAYLLILLAIVDKNLKGREV